MAAKLGSFRYSLLEKRDRTKGYPVLGLNNEEGEEEQGKGLRCLSSYKFISDKISGFLWEVQDVADKAWQMGKSDPRKIIFSAKMGLALMLISLLIFLKEPIEELTQHSVWAILTVVVVFEFSIGNLLLFFFLFLLFIDLLDCNHNTYPFVLLNMFDSSFFFL